MRPAVAGTFSISIMRRPADTVSRTSATIARAACRDSVGSAAVAIDTPNRPIGRYMSRNA